MPKGTISKKKKKQLTNEKRTNWFSVCGWIPLRNIWFCRTEKILSIVTTAQGAHRINPVTQANKKKSYALGNCRFKDNCPCVLVTIIAFVANGICPLCIVSYKFVFETPVFIPLEYKNEELRNWSGKNDLICVTGSPLRTEIF